MDLLKIALSKLGQGPICRSIEIDDPLGQFGELPPGLGPVKLEVELRSDAADGVRARGVARTQVEMECRRCLTPRKVPLEIEFGFWYRAPSDVTPGEQAVWPLGKMAAEVDLTDAIREELWVATPAFAECDPVCAGLCPQCGARLPDEPCACEPPEPDPRWTALGSATPQ